MINLILKNYITCLMPWNTWLILKRVVLYLHSKFSKIPMSMVWHPNHHSPFRCGFYIIVNNHSALASISTSASSDYIHLHQFLIQFLLVIVLGMPLIIVIDLLTIVWKPKPLPPAIYPQIWKVQQGGVLYFYAVAPWLNQRSPSKTLALNLKSLVEFKYSFKDYLN